LHFPAGVVVEQQVRETLVLPVWARLTWKEGGEHPYYLLQLGQTIELRRAKPKRTKSAHKQVPS
jgi:hypothetical protein